MRHKALIRRLQISCLGLDPIDPLRLLVDDVIEALRENAMREVQRLGQEIEQEPVGDEWTPCIKLPVIVHVRKQRHGETHVSTREGITPVNLEDLIMRGVSGEEYPIGRAIFEQTYSLDTTPPQRTWVGLTDEEIEQLEQDTCAMEFPETVRAIEAKLKDKNDVAQKTNS